MDTQSKLPVVALGLSLVALVFAALAWREARAAGPAPAGDWLQTAPQERVRQLERHLRGTDVAMWEIGYRFTELFHGGEDGNWDYAKYQAEKIELALRLALERRPKRAQSAQPFLSNDLPTVQQAIQARDPAAFRDAIERLRAGCVRCHTDEKLPFFTVELPERRISPVRTVR
ncbi:MAG: hypothetical protein ACRD4T_03215 [Candidatus Acidiferrales bacterium]